jgi:superfamily II DNA or RNA helicase
LVDVVLFHGSVRASHTAIASALAVAGIEGALYPNRLHSLLSGDPTRGVNTATLELLETAVELLDLSGSEGERVRLRSTILQRHAALGGRIAASSSEIINKIADEAGIPPAVVADVLHSANVLAITTEERQVLASRSPRPIAADWSFQNVAIRCCLEALRKNPNRKVGLIVPTGGGKTRIATQIALQWVISSSRPDSVVLWVTHRKRLHEQARRELQRTVEVHNTASPGEALTLFEQRIRFVMISELEHRLREYGDRVSLVVVDEAHHAAAPSYQPLFGPQALRGLFLTATPNRADSLPIGIDEIAFSITYRELFEKGAIVEPVFDQPLVIENLDWSRRECLGDLADYLLERADTDLRKILVAVSRTEHAEILFEVVREALDSRRGHVLADDDVAFVHGGASSTSLSPLDLLDEFAIRPRGILIATSQLIGEGFDDPLIDGVVVTYPSTSIGHLMQVAGRALRSTADKGEAHVIQVHAARLGYHFEQRWLYQDISDSLRPQLEDLSYGSKNELSALVTRLLNEHRVHHAVQSRILERINNVREGDRLNLLLTGLPYYGARTDFESAAPWGAVLVMSEDRSRFISVFNDFADRVADVKSHREFLANYLTPDAVRGSEWWSYMDMLSAMDYARKEIDNAPYDSEANRNYASFLGTSWLRYVTLEYRPSIPPALAAFLGDAINRDEIAALYLAEPERWQLAIKLPLPLAGTLAFVLDEAQTSWLSSQRIALAERLSMASPTLAFAELSHWRSQLTSIPVPLLIVDEIEHLISELRFDVFALSLQ